MTPIRRIAVIGNSLPRRCGIATFTTDLQTALATSHPDLETCIVAMTDRGQAYDYPPTAMSKIIRAQRTSSMPASTTRYACSTNSGFSAVKPVPISWRCCRA